MANVIKPTPTYMIYLFILCNGLFINPGFKGSGKICDQQRPEKDYTTSYGRGISDIPPRDYFLNEFGIQKSIN